MKQVINIILKKDKKIDAFREKYNVPTHILPHITLVYGFNNVEQKKLEEHLKKITANNKPFNITLKKFRKSTNDYYLYLLVEEGKKEVQKLYRELNKGILKGYKNKKFPRYIPHYSLGNLTTQKKFDTALQEAQKKDLTLKDRVTKVSLFTIAENGSLIKKKNYQLGE